MLIPSEKVIIQALDHDIRRIILRLLQARGYSFSELMKLLDIPSGKLNYHLSQIAGFITKNKKTGKYESTILGVKAIDLLDLLQRNITDEEAPFLCEAFITQLSGRENTQETILLDQGYLKGTHDAIDLIRGLGRLTPIETQKKEFSRYLSQIEAIAEKQFNELKKGLSSSPQLKYSPNFWLGVQRACNQASMHLIKRERDFFHFLRSMKLQATLLQNTIDNTQLKVEVSPLEGVHELIKGKSIKGTNQLIEALITES